MLFGSDNPGLRQFLTVYRLMIQKQIPIPHKNGRIVDVNNAIEGEGPFAPERSGGLPITKFLKYIYNNRIGLEEANNMIYGKGGLAAYFDTTDFAALMDSYQKGKDEKIKLVIDAMAYQISKEIASMAVAVSGDVDAIVFTGGLAYSKTFLNLITNKIKFISKNIMVFPGEDELLAMAEGILNYLKGDVEINVYI